MYQSMLTYLKTIIILFWITSSDGFDDLSGNKSATQSTTRPCTGCPDGSYIASMALDNDMTTCTATLLETNQWWMVDLLEIKSIYAIKFSYRKYGEIYRLRQQERLSGYSIYVSKSPEIKSRELCFKNNGSNSTSLTAEHVCVSFGRYIQFLNEKRTFIELCNLIVLGCNKGYYGVDCNHPCPQHCKNDQCSVTNGICFGCADGWTGSKCRQACSAGMFGPDCSLSCSEHCKYNSTCNPIDGNCYNGCTDGWMGEFCNKSCASGTFGPDCRYKCSGYCLNDSVCNRISGKCDKRCKPGYMGEQCKNVCGNGYFGANCSNVCSENCSDICHHIDGTCNCKAGMTDSPECIQVSSLTTAKKCDDHWLYAIGMSILIILNVLTCVLWICGRKRQMKVKRQSSSHYITTEAEMKEKTCESHEYQEVNSVSRNFSYQNLTFDT